MCQPPLTCTQVPVLEYRGHVLTESTIINEFLDETYPDVRLMPRSALDRAKAREAIDNAIGCLHATPHHTDR